MIIKNNYVIYVIICPITQNPIYIGQTKNFEDRKKQHLNTRTKRIKGSGPNIKIYLSYLFDINLIPKFIVLENVKTELESLELETEWINIMTDCNYPLLNKWIKHTNIIYKKFQRSYIRYYFEYSLANE